MRLINLFKFQGAILLVFLLVSTISFGKKSKVDFTKEVTYLKELRKKMDGADIMTAFTLNNEFKDSLRSLLNKPESISYNFDSLSSISVISGPKNEFRIYTWLVEESSGVYSYYGFTQYLVNHRTHKIKICELISNENSIGNTFEKLDTANWMGAVYYKVVAAPKRKEDTYLLLGWDGNGTVTKKKLIEPIRFNRKGIPTFGDNIFKSDNDDFATPRGKKNYRLVMEYSAKVSITLRYDSNLKMVVYDHLSPSHSRLKGVRAAYVPDFSYDGFQYQNGKWIHLVDVDARNGKTEKPTIFKPKDYEPKN